MNYYNKGSYFYDPTKILFKVDKGAQEIDLISDYDELYNLIQTL